MKLLQSLIWATDGIRAVWREEANFRTEVCVSAIVIALGAYFGITTIEWLFVIVAIGMVLSAETANTVIEDLCNKIEPQHDPTIGKIKDMMAGYVLVVVSASIVVCVVIFLNYF